MQKKFKKILCVTLLIALFAISFSTFAGCKDNQSDTKAKPQKAIIVLPGILGSVLIHPENEDAVWAAEDWDDIVCSMNYLIANDETNPVPPLYCNEEGTPLMELEIANENSLEQWRYGCNCAIIGGVMLTNLVNDLKQEFGDEYKVLVWQYDWRLSNVETAEKLENFIDENNYVDTVLAGHSMGGLVISQYLARSQKNIDNTELFVSIGTPFLGAIETLRVMDDNVNAMIKTEPINTMLSDFKDILDGILSSIGDSFLFATNFPSVYELLPYPEFNATPHFEDGETATCMVNGNGISEYRNFDNSWNYYQTKPWGLKSDGTTVKNMFETAKNARLKLYEKGNHISTYVDTLYICGNSIDTTITCNYSSANLTTKSNEGDGLVPFYSASCGFTTNTENVYSVDCEGGHMYLPDDLNVRTKIIEQIKSIDN